MRYPFLLCVTMILMSCAANAQDALTDRLQDPALQMRIDTMVRDTLEAEAAYSVTVQPELFRIDFADADCIAFYDEMADDVLGTCLLTASGWQMYAVFSVTFGWMQDGGIGLHPLSIVIE